MGFNLETLRWWQWAALGAIAGGLLATLRLSAPDIPIRTMGQDEFDNRTIEPLSDGLASIEDLQVRPGPGTGFTLTGRKLVNAGLHRWAYVPFTLNVDTPYKPSKTAWPALDEMPNVLAFLDLARQGNPTLNYSYAWWTVTWVLILLYTGGGAMVVGGAWPVLLRWMLGAGLGPDKPEELMDLSRFGEDEKPEGTAKAMTLADDAQLETAIAGLETSVSTEVVAAPPEKVAQAKPEIIVALPETELPTAPTAEPEEDKEFAGEFYPTVIHAEHGAPHKSV